MTKKPRARLLIVDDNPEILSLLGVLFEEENCVVTKAKSVQEAREQLKQLNGDVDLVLSDIQMPEETGFDLLQWMKRDESPYQHLPVLLTTAQLPQVENRIKGLEMGAVDYVVRPIELQELVIRSLHAIDNFQHIQQIQKHLHDTENLATVGRVLAASNHEMKNLAGIVEMIVTQVAAKLKPEDQDQEGLLKRLQQSSRLLCTVARGSASLLSDFRAAQNSVDLNQLVADSKELLEPLVKPVPLLIRTGESVWAKGDATRIKQILINLVLNAQDAIREADDESAGMIKIQTEVEDVHAYLRVIDNGTGFKEAGVRKDFKEFQSTKKLRGGQGLGLWLCSRLAAGMGGSLSLASKGLGMGAMGELTLPRGEPEEPIDISAYLD